MMPMMNKMMIQVKVSAKKTTMKTNLLNVWMRIQHFLPGARAVKGQGKDVTAEDDHLHANADDVPNLSTRGEC